MTKLILAIVMAASGVLGWPSRLAAQAAKPSLAWMKDYVGRPSYEVLGNPLFDVDVKAYLSDTRIPWSDKTDTPQDAARSMLEIPQTVYLQGDFVVVGGCMVHACGLEAVLVLANTNRNSPSLTLAFATPETNPDGPSTPAVLMKLYIDSSESLSALSDPPKPDIIRKWLQDMLIEHIAQTLFAATKGFSIVPMPDFLKSIPRSPILIR